ncbi:hypothetical protein ACJX0J_037393, partial [Zea mays]
PSSIPSVQVVDMSATIIEKKMICLLHGPLGAHSIYRKIDHVEVTIKAREGFISAIGPSNRRIEALNKLWLMHHAGAY